MHELRSPAAMAVALAALALTAGAACAQSPRSGGSAGAEVMLQMQQLASERTSLEAENAKLQKELDDMRKERDSLKKGQQANERRAQVSESAVRKLQDNAAAQRKSEDDEIAQWKQRMQELIAKFRETAQNLRDVETDRAAVKETLATRDQDLKACVDRNLALYKLNEEVLNRLEHESVWSRVAQAEPFTKIKRTQLENLVDEYKQRADDQRVATGAQGSAAPALGPSAAVSPASGK